MDNDHVKYLKKRYRESPSAEKKVKFSDLHDKLSSQFPSASWNYRAVSETIKAAFPHSVSKVHGKAHHRYIHGIDINTDSSGSQEKEELQEYVKVLEQRIAELEGVQSTVFTPEVVDSQVQQMLNPSRIVYHGPDTLQHFQSFCIDEVLSEIRTHTPDVLRLFQLIGKSDRHDDPESARVSQIMLMSSMVTLLKCRSIKVLGVQLLLTFMLIARATSKQVEENSKHDDYTTCITWVYISGYNSLKSHGSLCLIHDCVEVSQTAHTRS